MRTIFGNRKLLTEMQGQELDPRHLHLHCHRVHVRRGPNGLATFASDEDAGSGVGSQRSSLTLPPCACEKGSQWPHYIRFWQGCRVRNWIPEIFTYTATKCTRRDPNGLATFAFDRDAGSGIGSQTSSLTLPPCACEKGSQWPHYIRFCLFSCVCVCGRVFGFYSHHPPPPHSSS